MSKPRLRKKLAGVPMDADSVEFINASMDTRRSFEERVQANINLLNRYLELGYVVGGPRESEKAARERAHRTLANLLERKWEAICNARS